MVTIVVHVKNILGSISPTSETKQYPWHRLKGLRRLRGLKYGLSMASVVGFVNRILDSGSPGTDTVLSMDAIALTANRIFGSSRPAAESVLLKPFALCGTCENHVNSLVGSSSLKT